MIHPGVGISIFLFIATMVVFVLRPIYVRVNKAIRIYEEKIISQIQNETGLKISYKSLSPSIFSKIHIEGISFSDSLSGENILTVRSAVVRYNFMKVLTSKTEEAFEKIEIGDIDITINERNIDTVLALKKFIKEDEKTSYDKTVLLAKDVVKALPKDVSVRRINLNYSTPELNFSSSIRNISLEKNRRGNSLFINLNGYFNASPSSLGKKTAGASFRISGTILKNLSGSSLSFKLDEYASSDYTVTKNEFLLTFNNDDLALRSVQRVLPYSFHAGINFASQSLSVKMQCSDFDPLKLVKFNSSSKSLDDLRGSKITTRSPFILDMNLESSDLTWSADFSALLPPSVVKNQTVDVLADGDNQNIYVSSLKTNGSLADADFSGKFNLEHLQLSGDLFVSYVNLPNGNKVSTEVYFEPEEKGFMFFMPQLYLGEQNFTAIQGSVGLGESLSLSMELLDYSHADSGSAGVLSVNANVTTTPSPYLQASVMLENFFVDSLMNAAAYCVDAETAEGLVDAAAGAGTYVSNVELYCATDFKDFTFNSPVALVANTAKDKEVIFVSFDGTNSSVQISKLDAIFGSNSFFATASVDLSMDQITFITDFNFNSIPYSLSGSFIPNDSLAISGEYGVEAHVKFGKKKTGAFAVNNLPVSAGNFTANISIDTDFEFESLNNWSVFINNLEVYELTNTIAFHPIFNLKGEFTDKIFLIDSINYKDTVSELEGNGFLVWNYENEIFDNINLKLDFKNIQDEKSKEAVSLEAVVSNPMHLPLNAENLQKEFYFSGQLDVESFNLGRFFRNQTDENVLCANATFSGTVENPYLTLNVEKFSMRSGEENVNVSAEASYIENLVNIASMKMNYGDTSAECTGAEFDLNQFSGNAAFNFDVELNSCFIEGKLKCDIENLSGANNGGIPDSYSVTLNCMQAKTDIIEDFEPFKISLIRTPGRFDIITDEVLGAYGEYLDTGRFSFAVRDDKPLHFDAAGMIKDGKIFMSCEKIYLDTSKIFRLLDFEVIAVYGGIVEGYANVFGNISDPDYDCRFNVSDFEASLPDFLSEHIHSKEVLVEINQDEIVLPETVVTSKDAKVRFNLNVELNRGSVGLTEMWIVSLDDTEVPGDLSVEMFNVKGKAILDLYVTILGTEISASGAIKASDATASIIMNAENTSLEAKKSENKSKEKVEREKKKQGRKKLKKEKSKVVYDYIFNFDIFLGKKVQIEVNPLLRSLIAPSTPVSFSLDTAAGTWSVKGDIVLRGGEISYLSRNFYLKEGRMVLNENQNAMDPRITVRAETREHDLNGNPITITLSAINQNLSSFNATLSSTPARSENEIMQILGQILVGDSSSVSNFLVAGVDYGIQMTVLRRLEGALRDLLNFDIFSVRTTILQNTIQQGLSSEKSLQKRSVISNLFDNSTVYIGKYFGNDIYADALLHWSYDESRMSDQNGNGLVFQPEIGLELTAPFANIRWGVAPDLGELKNSWAKSSSITLSWHFDF